MKSLPALAVLLALAACGDLPRPFAGDPGATALRLAAPPPARLAVPPPATALLGDTAAARWATDTADQLLEREVPAVADTVHKGDWRLLLSARIDGAQVVPTYAVQNPQGEAKGSTEGPPVSAAQWANGDPAMLKQAAAAAAPKIATLLTNIEAARRESDPTSLMNRPARVMVPEVTGAPGDGNISLARQMRLELPKQGEVVQDTRTGADFVVQGQVNVVPVAGGQVRVEIQWVVTDARGKEAGRIVQMNEVPPKTVQSYWGDVAFVVAKEAAAGIKEVILNQADPRRTAEKQ